MDSSSVLKKLVEDGIVAENWDLQIQSMVPNATHRSIQYALSGFVPAFTTLLIVTTDRSAWSRSFVEFMKSPYGNEQSGLPRCKTAAEVLRIEIESGTLKRCFKAVKQLNTEYQTAFTRIREYILAICAEGTLPAESSSSQSYSLSPDDTPRLVLGAHTAESSSSRRIQGDDTPRLVLGAHTAESSSSRRIQGSKSFSPADIARLAEISESLRELLARQAETKEQIQALIARQFADDGDLVSSIRGRLEKIENSSNDSQIAIWSKFNSYWESRFLRESDEMATLVRELFNDDLVSKISKLVEKEMATAASDVSTTVMSSVEKSISSAIAESSQIELGDWTVNQLVTSIKKTIDATLTRQFQTFGSQAIHDAFKSSFETLLIPSFERTCRAMADQVSSTFQKLSTDNNSVSSLSLSALTLMESTKAVLSLTQTLQGELRVGHQKLIDLAAANANPLVAAANANPLVAQVEEQFDPTVELSSLVLERNYEEAFTVALRSGDVSVLSWLCSQVDMLGLLSTVPMPLSPMVLLCLLQQLLSDVSSDTSRKLAWITEVVAAINPADSTIAMHVRPVFELVHTILDHHCRASTVSGSDLTNMRLLMITIDSMLIPL